MPTIISPIDACYNKLTDKGWGLHTWWHLTGLQNVYSGSLAATDGYMITASVVWRDMTAESVMSNAADNIVANDSVVVGTCVETLGEDGLVLPAGSESEGNFALCHWFYYVGLSNVTGTTLGGTPKFDWGESRYLNEEEWGVSGSAIMGSRIQTLGLAIGGANGFYTSETTALTTYVAGAIYSMSWYQPEYATSYKGLRRYNGGKDFPSKVRGYCIGARTVTHKFATFPIANGDDDIVPAD